MVSTKPYLIRAIHEWCVDQGHTPYLSVQVDAHTRVPREHVREGQIVLNLGLEATNQLVMGNDEITFQARFSGKVFPVIVPVSAVAAIYAKENGQGMGFEVETVSTAHTIDELVSVSDQQVDMVKAADSTVQGAPRTSHLKRIK